MAGGAPRRVAPAWFGYEWFDAIVGFALRWFVSALLAGFYFIVSSTTDQRMRQGASADHDDHLRTVLAVRCVYQGLAARPDES